MIYPRKNLPVNWVDGMKISKDHFVDSDKYLVDLVRDYSSVNVNHSNFGLLPPSPASHAVFELHLAENSGNIIEAKLKYCEAITSGGFRVSIDNSNYQNPDLSTILKGSVDFGVNNNEVTYYEIVLVSDPYNRIPVGEPSLEENPPRHPFTEVRYTLQIIPSDQLNIREFGSYYLVLGRIKNTGGQLSVVQNYVPPCSTITSHVTLIQLYESLVNLTFNLQNLSLKIVRKIHEKNKPSNIAKNFSVLCKDLAMAVGQLSFPLKNEYPHLSPINFIRAMSSLASHIYISLQCMNPDEKEELLKYIYEWYDITPSDQEQALIECSDVKYNHFNMIESFLKVKAFLNTWESIWTKLNNLEFIGQRKENIVVAKETVQPVVEPPKKKWSILD